VVTICLKCLHKDAARRYESAAALADDLGRWLRGEPIVARPVGRTERATKWVRRNAVVSAAMATVTVTLLMGVGISGWNYRKASRANLQLGQQLENSQYDLGISYFVQATSAFERDGQYVDSLLEKISPSQRKFEWDYLKRRCKGDEFNVSNDGEISSLAFTPDGTRILVRHPYQLAVINARTSQRFPDITNQPADGTFVCQSADGRIIATGGEAGVIDLLEFCRVERRLRMSF